MEGVEGSLRLLGPDEEIEIAGKKLKASDLMGPLRVSMSVGPPSPLMTSRHRGEWSDRVHRASVNAHVSWVEVRFPEKKVVVMLEDAVLEITPEGFCVSSPRGEKVPPVFADGTNKLVTFGRSQSGRGGINYSKAVARVDALPPDEKADLVACLRRVANQIEAAEAERVKDPA